MAVSMLTAGERRRPWYLLAPTLLALIFLLLVPIGIMLVYTFYTFQTAGVETADFNTAASAQLATGGEPPIPAGVLQFANPVNLFKLRAPKNENLLTQAANDVYYVVASAYDYRTVAGKDKVLLWRTRMTVASTGLSQLQSLPELVRSAGPYFGKEMTEPELMNRHSVREGTVQVGTATVVDSPPPAAPPPAPATPPAKR